jgi:branched-chain amino acid transport system permease protein
MTDFLAFTVVGIVTGAVYAVAAGGLVVTYTTSGIFNFAHGAIGMFMAFVYWELDVRRGWPTFAALAVVLLILAPLAGALIESVLVRRLHATSTGVALVVTLALLVMLLGLAQSIWSPQEARTVAPFFNDAEVEIAGVIVSAHELIVIAVAAAIALLLRLFLYRTRMGITMRAIVDDRELGGLNGVYHERVSRLAWAIGASLAALAGILLAPAITLNHLGLTLLVVNGYAAAMLGRLRSLPLTFGGALLLGLAEAYAIGYGSGFGLLADVKPIIPTIFLFVILVTLPGVRMRAGRVMGLTTPRVPGLRESLVWSGGFVAVVAVLSIFLSQFWTFTVASALITGMVLLSLVLLSGYAGQVSLMQMAFVGVGAVVMGRLGDGGNVLGLIAAGLVAAAFGAVVAVPALRVRDIYLALTTLAFALFGEWAFNQPWMLAQGGILGVDRLDIGWQLRSERSQLILAAVAFCLTAVVVLAIRRGSYGRQLAAMRDSPTACVTLGLNLVATKATVFAVSAGIAGIAGALFGGLRTSVSAGDFAMLQSLFAFLIVTIGGITSVTGALFGGVSLAILPEVQRYVPIDNLQALGIGLAAMGLAQNPNGLAGNIALAGEAIRGGLARRRADTPDTSTTQELEEVLVA